LNSILALYCSYIINDAPERIEFISDKARIETATYLLDILFTLKVHIGVLDLAIGEVLNYLFIHYQSYVKDGGQKSDFNLEVNICPPNRPNLEKESRRILKMQCSSGNISAGRVDDTRPSLKSFGHSKAHSFSSSPTFGHSPPLASSASSISPTNPPSLETERRRNSKIQKSQIMEIGNNSSHSLIGERSSAYKASTTPPSLEKERRNSKIPKSQIMETAINSSHSLIGERSSAFKASTTPPSLEKERRRNSKIHFASKPHIMENGTSKSSHSFMGEKSPGSKARLEIGTHRNSNRPFSSKSEILSCSEIDTNSKSSYYLTGESFPASQASLDIATHFKMRTKSANSLLGTSNLTSKSASSIQPWKPGSAMFLKDLFTNILKKKRIEKFKFSYNRECFMQVMKTSKSELYSSFSSHVDVYLV
jgi:hypothetical protein